MGKRQELPSLLAWLALKEGKGHAFHDQLEFMTLSLLQGPSGNCKRFLLAVANS